jgi:hypothetical protein
MIIRELQSGLVDRAQPESVSVLDPSR